MGGSSGIASAAIRKTLYSGAERALRRYPPEAGDSEEAAPFDHRRGGFRASAKRRIPYRERWPCRSMERGCGRGSPPRYPARGNPTASRCNPVTLSISIPGKEESVPPSGVHQVRGVGARDRQIDKGPHIDRTSAGARNCGASRIRRRFPCSLCPAAKSPSNTFDRVAEALEPGDSLVPRRGCPARRVPSIRSDGPRQ